MKERVLNSATVSSCHHNLFVYLAKHLYNVKGNAMMNKVIVMSSGPCVSAQRSGIQKSSHNRELTPKVAETGLCHSLLLG